MKTTAIAFLVVGQLTLLPVAAALTHIRSAGTMASVGEPIKHRNVTVIYKRIGYEIISNKLSTGPWRNSKARLS